VNLSPALRFRASASLFFTVVLAALATAAGAGQSNQKLSPTEVLSTTAENGKKTLSELTRYSYYSELTIQTVSQADVITGAYNRFSQISYDEAGVRQEKLFEEKSTLPKETFIGSNAANAMARVYQFMITPEALDQYEFNYVGRERVDELDTYVFDVKPKVKLPDPEKSRDRYLRGRVWIDDQDFQVVKVSGQALPEQSAHRTPKFETIFQNYGKYWFPAYTSADDEIRVGRRVSRVIVKVRFTSFKKLR
jgi:hypothetical protein